MPLGKDNTDWLAVRRPHNFLIVSHMRWIAFFNFSLDSQHFHSTWYFTVGLHTVPLSSCEEEGLYFTLFAEFLELAADSGFIWRYLNLYGSPTTLVVHHKASDRVSPHCFIQQIESSLFHTTFSFESPPRATCLNSLKRILHPSFFDNLLQLIFLVKHKIVDTIG